MAFTLSTTTAVIVVVDKLPWTFFSTFFFSLFSPKIVEVSLSVSGVGTVLRLVREAGVAQWSKPYSEASSE